MRSGNWTVRYVHKIAPSPNDEGPGIYLPGEAFTDRKTLGKALRERKILAQGGRVKSFREEGDKVIVFPAVGGLTTYWHSIILTANSLSLA